MRQPVHPAGKLSGGDALLLSSRSILFLTSITRHTLSRSLLAKSLNREIALLFFNLSNTLFIFCLTVLFIMTQAETRSLLLFPA